MIHMNESEECTFVFAGGGTGGHIYPGLAVAAELRLRSESAGRKIRIVWIGNASGMDRALVEKSDVVDAFIGIPSGKLRRYFSLRNFTDCFKIAAGFLKSLFVLAKMRPALLFSKGGFVSVPPCAAASILHIPVMTHECDVTPGLATRINSRFASKILLSYEMTRNLFSAENQKKIVVTGNPVRPEFYSADVAAGRKFLFSERPDYDSSKPVLLVLGGSLGAHQINSLVAENIDWLCERFTVVHQCGAADAGRMSSGHSGYFLHPFIYKEMCDVVACSDVVLSRAGANSLWECSVLGKPLVLVPLSGAGTRGDQVDNARFFEAAGAAVVLMGESAESAYLKSSLENMLDPDFRERCARASARLSEGVRPAVKIAESIFQFVFGVAE